MEQEVNAIEDLFDKASEYGRTNYELVKLKTVNKASGIVSSAGIGIITYILTSVCVLFLNIAAALWLGDYIGKPFYGFLWVAAFYALLTIIICVLCRKSIKTALSSAFISSILNK